MKTVMSALRRVKQRQVDLLRLSAAQSETDFFVTFTCILKNINLKLKKACKSACATVEVAARGQAILEAAQPILAALIICSKSLI